MQQVPRRVIVLLLVVAGILVLGLVVPYFLNADRYRPWVVSAIEQATGRKVVLGEIRVRLLPRPAFVLEDFRLGNPPGFAPGNVLTAEAIRGNLAWGPLLHREFQLSSVELERPKFFLLEDDRGRTNYEFAGSAPVTRQSASQSAWSGNVDGVELREAEISFAQPDGAAAPSFRITKFNAVLRRVSSQGDWLRGWDADAHLADAQMEIRGLPGPVEFRSGKLELHRGAVDVDFEAELGKTARVKGSLEVPNIEKAAATFNLSTPLLDLDPFFQAAGAGDDPAPPSRQQKHELIAQGLLKAGRIRWEGVEASQGAAEIRFYTDRLEIWPMMMALSGGSLGVSLWLDQRERPERFSANVTARDIDLAQLLAAWPATRGKISGRGEFTAQLFGSPGPRWKDALGGNGKFILRDGTFPGLDLRGALKTVARVEKALGLSRGSADGATRFGQILGDFAVAHGRVSSQRIHMDADKGTVDLRGSCGLDGSLDYLGQADLTPGSGSSGQNSADLLGAVIGGVLNESGGPIRVPFALRGKLENPRIEPTGLPTVEKTSPTQATPPQQQKKSILDLFRQPPN